MISIEAVLTGRIEAFGPRGEPSAIVKGVVDGPTTIGFLGLEGDAQADRSVHGGRDKAIHHYPRDHYAWWRTQIGSLPLFDRAGAFGENVSTTGLTEDDVCIGDRYRLGTALVEVSQGRQPCWKQAHRLGHAATVRAMVRSGRSGWYYRVIEEGSVARGDAMLAVERLHPEWTVARTTALVVAGVGRDSASLRELATISQLAARWRPRRR